MTQTALVQNPKFNEGLLATLGHDYNTGLGHDYSKQVVDEIDKMIMNPHNDINNMNLELALLILGAHDSIPNAVNIGTMYDLKIDALDKLEAQDISKQLGSKTGIEMAYSFRKDLLTRAYNIAMKSLGGDSIVASLS